VKKCKRDPVLASATAFEEKKYNKLLQIELNDGLQ
jgi:hypothetical protein